MWGRGGWEFWMRAGRRWRTMCAGWGRRRRGWRGRRRGGGVRGGGGGGGGGGGWGGGGGGGGVGGGGGGWGFVDASGATLADHVRGVEKPAAMLAWTPTGEGAEKPAELLPPRTGAGG